MPDTPPIYLDEALQKELYEIYGQYHYSIKVLVGELEVLQNKFPVEILNEIRAVFSHIAKIYTCDSIDTVKENLVKAKGHMKRAQLDSFKYMGYAYKKYYQEFIELYKNVDLSNVNNGEFIDELSKLNNDSISKTETAKKIEADADNVEDSYDAYEESYNAYTKLYNHIKSNLKYIYKLQQKEKLQQEQYNNDMAELKQSNENLQKEVEHLKDINVAESRKSKIFTWLSIGLGVLSVVLGIITLT